MTEDARQTLQNAIQDLYRQAGCPSLRQIADRTSGAVSHMAVSNIVHHPGPRPRWVTVAQVIKALGGDPADYLDLFTAAHPPPATREARKRTETATLIKAMNDLTAAVNDLTAAIDRNPPTR